MFSLPLASNDPLVEYPRISGERLSPDMTVDKTIASGY